ncbi:hypothetical protein [Sideroxydans lithotrophicus]|uniref:Transmembrane protein n=1 Tax=Sideroxydans lithotrophicus (strain ES-1) TaxID=580332 RepID=D5CPS0_SIDLE|nr:hypothetical protein [Sideroxydans lithotrophicus]ADE13065.1 hypothetical protein Slit_2840 [Sideroxydans lithotrophicus ES-1]
MSKQLIASSIFVLALLIGLLIQYKALDPARRNSLWLLILGFSALTCALFINEHVQPFFHYATIYVFIAMLPALAYAGWKTYSDPNSINDESLDNNPPASQWSGLATIADKFWFLVMFACLFVCMFGTMLISAAYLTPLVLGVSNCTPRDSVGKIVEPVMLFGGLGLGIILGLICVSFISRKFISAETHGHWAKSFEAQASSQPLLLGKAMRYVNRLMLPREQSLT